MGRVAARGGLGTALARILGLDCAACALRDSMRSVNSDSGASVGEIVEISAPDSSTSSALTIIASPSSFGLSGSVKSISVKKGLWPYAFMAHHSTWFWACKRRLSENPIEGKSSRRACSASMSIVRSQNNIETWLHWWARKSEYGCAFYREDTLLFWTRLLKTATFPQSGNFNDIAPVHPL